MDTIYSKIGPDSTDWELSYTRLSSLTISNSSYKPRLWPALLSQQLNIDQRFPMTLSLDLINLLGGSLNSGNASLDHWFVIKIYNSGTARWKRCKGQGMGKGFSPVKPRALYLHVFINLDTLWAPSFVCVCGWVCA